MSPLDVPPALEHHLRRAYGVVNVRRLRTLSVGRSATSALLAADVLAPLYGGLLRDARAEAPPEQPGAAALAYLQRSARGSELAAALTGSAALAQYGLDGFTAPTEPVVAVDRDRRVRAAGLPFSVLRDPPGDTRCPGGLRCVEVGRAIVDYERAEAPPTQNLRHAVDAGRWNRAIDLPSFAALLRARPRLAPRLLALVEGGAFEQESDGEREAFRTLFGRRPPAPDCQVWILPSIRVDFAFVFAALCLEYLGEVHEASLQEDTSRAFAASTTGGYLLLGVTSKMLRDPEAVVDAVHDQRRQRERLARRGLLPRAPLPDQRGRLTPLRTLTAFG